ncbi:hypothetical protein IE077_003991 [Cardiosporidium cionae]|uniref:Leishmanolysin n=1 Tax=Cardiosporidium cionae TaxID=476202 RepID=A0ABQ7J717_9APIC|nr:hypothetical protein IE077_003991 [Cardiosporidium cionae]|eukprot:KAF8819795.1 hypothetical protein IE077_003991 [Cardiosporidium cionae]
MTSSFQKVFHLFDGGIAAVTLLMLYATLWCNIIGSSSAYECIHDTFVAEKELNGLTLDVPSQDTRNDLRNLQSGLTYSNFDSIRIAFLTDGLSTFKSSAPSDFALFTERILPAVAKKLSSTFRVRRILSGLGLRRPCTTLGFLTAPNGLSVRACAVADANNVGTCIVSPIPQGLYSEDIFVCNDASLTNCTFRKGNAGLQSADFTVLVNVDTSATCSGHSTALAFAGICFRDSNTDRPLISELTFCNSAINSMRRDPRTGVDTLLHEVLHGLGFSVSYYPRFRFDNGTARTARSASGRPLASNTTVLDGVVVGPRSQINNYLVTETAREYARSYFGCAGTRGISLEAQGGGGSAGSHVEQTSFFEDTMVAIGGTDTVLTNATLTILRDSGWYNIEFDQAGNPQW